jgi:hypothetical protein
MAVVIAASIGFASGFVAHLLASALKGRKPEVVSGESRLERAIDRFRPAREAIHWPSADERRQLILDTFAVIAATEIARRRR